MENLKPSLYERMKPFIAVIFLQTGFAGMDVLTKAALNKGMSNYVLVVYRHVVAFLVIAPFAVILDKSLSFSVFLLFYALFVCMSNLSICMSIPEHKLKSILYFFSQES